MRMFKALKNEKVSEIITLEAKNAPDAVSVKVHCNQRFTFKSPGRKTSWHYSCGERYDRN